LYIKDNWNEEIGKKEEIKNLFDIYKTVYDDKDKKSYENISLIKNVLDYLSLDIRNNNNEIHIREDKYIYDDKHIFKNFLKESPNYHERSRFYALIQYFNFFQNNNNEQNEIENEKNNMRWMRVLLNLINNTYIENLEDFYKAIKSIKKLSDEIKEYSFDIYNFIRDENNKIDFFNREQITEERLKAELIDKDNKWEELFITIEKHDYFDGQIGFILEYSKEDNSYNQVLFNKYAKILSILFNKDFQNEKEYNFKFKGALLTKGDYLVAAKHGNLTFCNYNPSLESKNENWRRVFREETKTKYLKELLKDILINNENDITKDKIISELDNIIEQSKKESTIKDWKKHFIEKPVLYYYGDKIRIHNNQYYMLNSSEGYMNSWHTELHIVTLFEIISNDFKECFTIKYKPWNTENVWKPPIMIIVSCGEYNVLNIEIEISFNGNSSFVCVLKGMSEEFNFYENFELELINEDIYEVANKLKKHLTELNDLYLKQKIGNN